MLNLRNINHIMEIIVSMILLRKYEVDVMAVSYKKLWKLLIDRDMKKKDLRELAEISNSSIAKMGRNENINTEVLVKICSALHCDIGDIMEITTEEDNSQDTDEF